ncbi:MAG: hypothetical protein ACP5M4_07475 [Acidobacteriaceae bacterium]
MHPPSCCLVLLKIAYFFAVFLAAFLAGAFLAAFLVAIVYSPFSTCVGTTAFLLQLTECIELRNHGVKKKIEKLLQSFVPKFGSKSAAGF